MTTSARRRQATPSRVSSPGAPGPAPTRYTYRRVIRRASRARRISAPPASRSRRASLGADLGGSRRAAVGLDADDARCRRAARSRARSVNGSPSTVAYAASGVTHEPRHARGRRARRRSPRASARCSRAASGRTSSVARLERQGALPDGRHEAAGSQSLRVRRIDAEAPQAGAGQHHASNSPSASLRRRVSTLPRRSTTCRAGYAARSSAARRRLLVPTRAPAGRRVEAARLARHQHVARVFALRHRGQDQPGRQLGGQVLHRVHRAVDLAGTQRLLDLLDEQPLAADRAQAVRRGSGRLTVRMTTSSARRPACASSSRRRTQSAWASASRLPRVPIRRTPCSRVFRAPRDRTGGASRRCRTPRCAGPAA